MNMFQRTVPAAEVTPPVDVDAPDPRAENLIPLRVLELELDVPPGGWAGFLSSRGISIVVDDVGRLSVARADAKALISERRQGEARAREVAERQEQAFIEADRQRRSQIWGGLPADRLPVGVSAGAAMAQAAHDAAPRRQSVVEAAFNRVPGRYTVEPLPRGDE
jgi:hypothetical protein